MRGAIYTGLLLTFGMLLLVVGLWSSVPKSALQVGTPIYTFDSVRPAVSAKAWLVFDAKTGVPLRGAGGNMQLPIASVTKLMTADAAYAHLNMQASTSVSARAVATEGRAGRLSAGEHISLYELLFPLLLESSNDAAEVIAEHGGGEKFLALMNGRAEALGMHDTYFFDASGLSPHNISTPHDLSLLLSSLYTKDRHILDITSLHQYIGERHDWLNNDPVIVEADYLGGKHGYTEEAGKTFTGIFSQSLQDGGTRDIGIILLHSADIKSDVAVLRSYMNDHVAYGYQF